MRVLLRSLRVSFLPYSVSFFSFRTRYPFFSLSETIKYNNEQCEILLHYKYVVGILIDSLQRQAKFDLKY